MANRDFIRATFFSAISKAKSFDELGRVIVENLALAFDAEVCTIWRRYTDDKGAARLRLLAASAKAPQTLAQEVTYAIYEDDLAGDRCDGVTGYVAQTCKEVHVSAFQELLDNYGHCWKGRMDRTQWEGQPQIYFRSLYALPLILGERLVGVLKLENKRSSDAGFPEMDRQVMRDLAPEIALVVYSYGLLESHERRMIQIPASMVAALLGPFETKQLVSEIVKAVAEGLHAEICSLWLVHTTVSGRELRLADGYGFSTEGRLEQTYFLPQDSTVYDKAIDGITAWVAVRKRPFWANSWEELKAHPSWKGKWDQSVWHNRSQRFRCLYAIPLLCQSEVIGVLKVENRKAAAFFTESDRALCDIMASLIVLVLDLGQQLRTSLISDLAHLIRSPIGQVPVNLQGLERELLKLERGEAPNLERIHKYLNFMKRALLVATLTSRTLADYARHASEPSPVPDPSTVNLISVICERLEEFRLLLPDGVTFETSFPPELNNEAIDLDVTDIARLQIVIDNIIHNAIKYSPEGSRVIISLRRSNRSLLLVIQDFGTGIAKEDQSRIFEAGFTRRAPGFPHGTGMGLTTVKKILDHFGWGIDVTSELGQGSTFSISIPEKG